MMNPSQLHQVILNLCTNAAHAMQETGGVLEVKLSEVYLDQKEISVIKTIFPGSYLRITVSDTGHGISKELQDRIFEPYFTTKEKGVGTGLGLSVVHDIIKNHKGGITVYSEPDKGCTFNVYLPKVSIIDISKTEITEEDLPRGEGHILFVDDEEMLVLFGKQILEILGYKVTTRTCSIEALQTFRNHPNKFDLSLPIRLCRI